MMRYRVGTMRTQDAIVRIKTLLLDVQWSASQYAQDDDGALEADGLAAIARQLQQLVERYAEEAAPLTPALDDAADDELPLA
jgi:hypothetical protein